VPSILKRRACLTTTSQKDLIKQLRPLFDLLTKMRQAVDHPYLIVYSKKRHAEAQAAANQGAPVVSNGFIDCDLCSEPPTDRVVSSCCNAAFCRMCVLDYMSPALENANRDNTHCPSCRAPFSIDLNQASADIEDNGTIAITTTGDSIAGMPSLKELSHVASGSILRRINLTSQSIQHLPKSKR
jgi:DNA repair protein RAD16